jgi:hypothetical protein
MLTTAATFGEIAPGANPLDAESAVAQPLSPKPPREVLRQLT